jgi:shikimate dehydrogenase
MIPQASIRLGLIGDNIKQSRSPELHRIAGELCGLDVSYDLLIPPELGQDFETTLAAARERGLRGVNVTHPYKERAAALATAADPLIARIGAVNTVVFDAGGINGHNTDYTGFIAAYRGGFGERPPGTVAIVGAGGAGRAIAFALMALGARELRIADRDAAKAEALAAALRGGSAVRATSTIAEALAGADGAVNATPVGMAGHPGTAIAPDLLRGLGWAFDAVYTPVETRFKSDAEAQGLATLSGYELYLHQGIQAFEIFAGRKFEFEAELRARLARPSRNR